MKARSLILSVALVSLCAPMLCAQEVCSTFQLGTALRAIEALLVGGLVLEEHEVVRKIGH